MFIYILKRLLLTLPVLFGVAVATFLLLHMVRGDPAAVVAGPNAPPETVERIRTQLGLDQPLPQQFGGYLARLAQGDLGRSIISRTSVLEELGHALGPTAELVAATLIWSIPLGILLGIVAARRRGSLIDRAVMALSVVGLSTPVFWTGLVLVWLIGYRLELLPFTGRGGPLWSREGVQHLILPSLTLGSIFVGPIARLNRTTMLEILELDFIRTAKAKGLSQRVVVMNHALRNALLPLITLIGLQFGYLIGGAVVTEMIFAWPGMGRLVVGAILSSDFPMVQGAILLLAMIFIFINLLVDILYAYFDPRIRY